MSWSTPSAALSSRPARPRAQRSRTTRAGRLPATPQQETKIMGLTASDFDKSKYFRAEDIEGEDDRKLRIKNVTAEGFDREGAKERKLVLWFSNDDRGLVLNKTNNRTLRGAFGDNTDDWIGKVVIVFTTVTDFRGKMTPGLRVRIPPPKEAAAGTKPGSAKGNGTANPEPDLGDTEKP